MKPLRLNNLGRKYLVEDCRKVSANDFVRKAKQKLKEALINTELQYSSLDVRLTTSVVNKNGIRYWFACPICQKRMGVLYVHPVSKLLGCRVCLNLKYKKSQFKGMVENL